MSGDFMTWDEASAGDDQEVDDAEPTPQRARTGPFTEHDSAALLRRQRDRRQRRPEADAPQMRNLAPGTLPEPGWYWDYNFLNTRADVRGTCTAG